MYQDIKQQIYNPYIIDASKVAYGSVAYLKFIFKSLCLYHEQDHFGHYKNNIIATVGIKWASNGKRLYKLIIKETHSCHKVIYSRFKTIYRSIQM